MADLKYVFPLYSTDRLRLDETTPELVLLRHEAGEHIETALRILTPLQRITLRLRFMYEVSRNDVASMLHMKLDKLRYIENKALKRMRHPSHGLRQFLFLDA
jgi:DNA-directed RNA polymerase specialized sigma24 family protein